MDRLDIVDGYVVAEDEDWRLSLVIPGEIVVKESKVKGIEG